MDYTQTTEEKVDSSKALDASLVIIESNGTESQKPDTSTDHGMMRHLQELQHTEQPEFNNEGEVDQNAEQCHDIRPLPAKLTDNMTTELSDQSLESENAVTLLGEQGYVSRTADQAADEGTNSYEFLLANKKCLVDVEVFRKILDICPRVQGVDFAEVPDDDATLTFLIDLGYKGPLHKHTNMLRESRIDILWGMFYRENVNYPELIWEDFAFQIDNRQLKKGRPTEYGLPILETMLAKGIKQSESYQMFIKYSTGQIPPKKSRGKGSQGKKTADTPEADVDVSEESDSEPARKRTASRRVIKKKVTISADDNIIPDPDVALELGKSISLTEAIEEEAARQVHATHARIVTEFIPEPARRRPSGIAFRDTSSVTKKLSPDLSQKLKGILTLTPKEKLAADTMKALKESKKTSRRQPGSEQESEYSDEDDNDDDDDDKSIDLEKTDDEETDNEFTEEVKDDIKKAEHPLTSSRLSVSSGFSNQFLNLSSDTSLIGTVKDTTDAEINSLLDVQIQQEIPHIQSPSVLNVPISMISGPSFLTPIPETPLVAPATTLLPHPYVSAISLKDVQELKEADNTITLRASLRSEIPSTVNTYLGFSLGDALHKVMNQLPKFLPKAVSDFATLVIQSTTIRFEKIDKSRSYQTHDKHQALYDALLNSLILDDDIARGQANAEKVLRKRDCNEEDPSAGPNQGKKTKRSKTKESEPSKKSSTSKESSRGKSPGKTSKFGKSLTAEEPVEELVFEMASDDIDQTVDDVVKDVDQPHDDST
ncbi:hypothetical protein Tco_0221054 [Tanacetum coccineum]